MKKFFAIAVIAASLVACGGSEEKKATDAVDSTVNAAKANMDSTVSAVVDSAKASMDSTVKAVVDSVKK